MPPSRRGGGNRTVPPPPLPEMVRTPADRRAVAAGCHFDQAAAERVYHFFTRFLRHSVGEFAGRPFIPEPWQWADVIAPLFGWRRADGTRRFREAYIEIPKKNGKSTLAAGLGLYLLMADGEAAPEVYCAAADRNQASIVFREALRMVEGSAALKARLWPVPSQKQLLYPAASGMWQVLSSEAHTKEGFNIHGLLFDEFHAQPSPELYDALKYGGAARRQPLFAYLTTAGYDRESVCWAKHCYAKAVLADEKDDSEFFAYVAAAEEEANWKDEGTWKRANPNYGVTVNPDHFRRMARVAVDSPLEENTFKRYHLNIWTEQDVRWLALEAWDACRGDVGDLEGEDCYAGLDLSSTRDLTAFVLFFPEQAVLLPFFWVPAAALRDRIRQKKTKLDAWVASKLIRVTGGNAADHDAIEKDVLETCRRFRVRKIGVDRWNMTRMASHLMDAGLDVAAVGQGFGGLSAPMKMFERMVVNGQVRHDGNPVLRWMFGNVAVKQDPAGNIKPDKSKAADKIDGIVAGLMAMAAWMEDPEGVSIYEGQGIDFI